MATNPPRTETVLPGYDSQLGEDACLHSRQKLTAASEELETFVAKDGLCSIRSVPCESDDESLGYRCKCSFQIIYEEGRNQY